MAFHISGKIGVPVGIALLLLGVGITVSAFGNFEDAEDIEAFKSEPGTEFVKEFIDEDKSGSAGWYLMIQGEYFVDHKCKPKLLKIDFEGIDLAQISNGFEHALETCDALVISPSNPYVSIDPILSINTVREKIQNFNSIKIAVSPIVNGNAIKGPAAKMLNEFGEDVSCVGIAKLLHGICDVLIIDSQDLHEIKNIEKLGINAVATNTIMNSDEDKIQLAEFILKIINNQTCNAKA